MNNRPRQMIGLEWCLPHCTPVCRMLHTHVACGNLSPKLASSQHGGVVIGSQFVEPKAASKTSQQTAALAELWEDANLPLAWLG